MPLSFRHSLFLAPHSEGSAGAFAQQDRDSATQTGTTAKRVLVVDDNEDSADTLALLLELMGHESRAVHDGLQALEAAESFLPHIVLLDIGLPRLDGYEVCRRLRQQPWGQSMVLVALTGWGQAEDHRKSTEAGFNRHLVKPVEEAVLRQVLDEMG